MIYTVLKVVQTGDFFSGTDDTIHEFCGNAASADVAKDIITQHMQRLVQQDIKACEDARWGTYTVDDYAIFTDDKDEDIGLTVLKLKRREGYTSVELERYKIFTAPVYQTSTEASFYE